MLQRALRLALIRTSEVFDATSRSTFASAAAMLNGSVDASEGLYAELLLGVSSKGLEWSPLRLYCSNECFVGAASAVTHKGVQSELEEVEKKYLHRAQNLILSLWTF